MDLIGVICILVAVISVLAIKPWKHDNLWKDIFPLMSLFIALSLFILGLEFVFRWFELLPEKIPGIDKPELIGAVIGFFVTHALGPLIPLLKKYSDCPDCPQSMDEKTWEILVRSANRGGVCIGYVERTLFYISFFLNPLYIGGLLTFKVLAKWEAWKNIVKVPEKDVGLFKYNASDFFLFRFKWGGYFMTTFIIGTFSNIIFAAVGYGLYTWVVKVLDP